MPDEPFWLRHDLHIVACAAVMLALGWAVGEKAGGAPMKTVSREGVSVRVPADWIADPASGDRGVMLRGEDSITRLELRLLDKPAAPLTVDSALELERGQRYGQLYQRLTSERLSSGGREWLRTEFSYAFKPTATHAPRVATGVEYAYPADAAVNAERLYVVTLHAPEGRVAELERTILGSIALRQETR